MDATIRALVRRRASCRCEYCHFPDHALGLPFHVEHILASIRQKDDRTEDLAWACPRCNFRKGPNLVTIDHETGQRVDLFNPRTMTWNEHFTIGPDGHILGRTSCGRGTVRLLNMNGVNRLHHRRALIDNGEFEID